MTLTRKYLMLVGLLKKRIITPKQVFFNWDSLRTWLNRDCKSWSYKKKKHRRLKYSFIRCILILDHLDHTSKESIYSQRISESSCARKETVDIDTLVTSRNGDPKIMQSIKITSRPLSRKRIGTS